MGLRNALIAAVWLVAPSGAQAHPHVWTDFASEMMFDDKSRLTAIRHHWRFDDQFSAYALQGLDSDRDGAYSQQELQPLARENIESLKDYDYFTFLSVGDYQAGFSAPTDYHIELSDGRLLLHFTLPLAMPLLTRGTAHLEVFDPEYYVAFTLPSIEAVRLVDAPAACRLTVRLAQEPDAAAAAALATIGPDRRQLPPELQSLTAGVENSADVTCGGLVAGAGNAAGAASQMAQARDLTALPADAPSSEVVETAGQQPAATPAAAEAAPAGPAASSRAGLLRRWTVWIGGVQTEFNRDLTDALKGLKEGGAFWWLGGVSFLYGIVHAAGPGHGKVVISSYLLANEARLRRGVLIAFVAAFVQACVAVGIIGLMAVILNRTSMAIDSTAKVFEAGSFALVAGLGLYLLARKGRAAWTMLRGGDVHHHHHHGHGHEQDARPSPQGGGGIACTHDHSPDPIALKPGFAGAAAAIVSVGIRPCSGALVVLVFALSQGVFWAGAASTFVMALGTAITVAALAAFAVGAKGMARRLAAGDDRRGAQAMLGLELAAALLLIVLGVTLFLGTVYA